MEAKTAAPGFEGSPMEVPGVRGMRAISVVGIFRVDVVVRYGGSLWWLLRV